MNYELLRVKSRMFVEAAVLYAEVEKRKGDVSEEFASKLAAYRLPLTLIVSDVQVGEIAKYTLIAVNYGLDYIKSRSQTDLQAMVDAHKHSDKLINKFMAEMALGDVINVK